MYQAIYTGSIMAQIECRSLTPATWQNPRKDILSKKDSLLIIYYPSSKDAGNYTCFGTSSRGYFTAVAEIQIGSKLIFTLIRKCCSTTLFPIVKDNSRIKPNIVNALLGSPTIMHCNSSESNTWQVNSLRSPPIFRKQNFSIPVVTYRHNGNYFCIGQYQNKNIFIAQAKLKVYSKITI